MEKVLIRRRYIKTYWIFLKYKIGIKTFLKTLANHQLKKKALGLRKLDDSKIILLKKLII